MSESDVITVWLAGAAIVCACFFVLGWVTGASFSAFSFLLGYGPKLANTFENPGWFWVDQAGWAAMAAGFGWLVVSRLL